MKTRFVLHILSLALVACQGEEFLGTLTENSERVSGPMIIDGAATEVWRASRTRKCLPDSAGTQYFDALNPTLAEDRQRHLVAHSFVLEDSGGYVAD